MVCKKCAEKSGFLEMSLSICKNKASFYLGKMPKEILITNKKISQFVIVSAAAMTVMMPATTTAMTMMMPATGIGMVMSMASNTCGL